MNKGCGNKCLWGICGEETEAYIVKCGECDNHDNHELKENKNE